MTQPKWRRVKMTVNQTDDDDDSEYAEPAEPVWVLKDAGLDFNRVRLFYPAPNEANRVSCTLDNGDVIHIAGTVDDIFAFLGI